MINSPTVSVLVCTQNRIQYLIDCLSSLLRQSYKPLEIIIVDDASDEKLDISSISKNIFKRNFDKFSLPKKINIIYFRNKKKLGVVKSRNIGISFAKGDIVAFVDDDSVASKSWLRNLVKNYSSNVVGVGGTIVETGREIGQPKTKIRKISYFSRNGDVRLNARVKDVREIGLLRRGKTKFLQGSNMSFRRQVLNDLKRFNPIYKGNCFREETDICMRAAKVGDVIFEPDAIVYHRTAKVGGTRDVIYLKDFFYWYFRNTGILLVNHLSLMKGLRILYFQIKKYLRNLAKKNFDLNVIRDYLIFDSKFKTTLAMFSGAAFGIILGLVAEHFLKGASYETRGYATLLSLITTGVNYKIIVKRVSLDFLRKKSNKDKFNANTGLTF